MSYLTVTEANTYFANRLHTQAWDEASTTSKTKALAEATIRIDRLRFAGWKVEDTQDNEFPRYTNWDDGPDGTETTPDDIKYATAELATVLLDGVEPDLEYENLAVSSTAFSSVRTTRVGVDSLDHVAAGIPSRTAWNYLRPWLAPDRRLNINRV